MLVIPLSQVGQYVVKGSVRRRSASGGRGYGVARARSVSEFQTSFPDETSCAAFLFERRWPQGFVCPACGGGHGSVVEEPGAHLRMPRLRSPNVDHGRDGDAPVQASTGTSRSKPCSGSPRTITRRVTEISSGATISAKARRQSGASRGAARQRPACRQTDQHLPKKSSSVPSRLRPASPRC
jgi:hypothetical protein